MTGSIEGPVFAPGPSYLYVCSVAMPYLVVHGLFSRCAQTPGRVNVVADLSRVQNESNRQDEPRIIVHSEDDPDRILLETRICREDGFQKQQGTCNDHGLGAMR